jgi:hypothetical protein
VPAHDVFSAPSFTLPHTAGSTGGQVIIADFIAFW